jgi:hypothetical protein
VWLGLLAAAACGGVSTRADEAGSGPRGAPKSSRPAEEADFTEADDEAAASPASTRCDDDSCFACGQGICLKGFFCDERAIGGAACGWLPSCAAQPSCACVKRALGSGCSCEERGGGVYVTC